MGKMAALARAWAWVSNVQGGTVDLAQARRIKPQQPAMRTGMLRLFHGMLREASFWAILALALGMLGALATFDPRDPAWTQTAHVEQLHNVGGVLGAWFADVALYFFGYPAALLPLGVAFAGWRLFKRGTLLELDAEIVLFRVLGFGVALANACALASLHLKVFPATLPGDNAAGGLVGVYVAQFLTKTFGFTGGNAFMGGLFLAGVTLMTGIPWLTMIDLIGAGLLKVLDAAGWLVMTPLRLLSAPTRSAHTTEAELAEAEYEVVTTPTVSNAVEQPSEKWQATRAGLEQLRARCGDYAQMLRAQWDRMRIEPQGQPERPRETAPPVKGATPPIRLKAVQTASSNSDSTVLPEAVAATKPKQKARAARR